MAKNKKTAKLIKTIIICVLIQVIMFITFIETTLPFEPISMSDCEKTTITVEEKFSRGLKNSKRYYITYGDVDYFVSKGNANYEVGQKLEILYFKDKYFFRTIYRVVDARNGEKVFYSFDDYTYDYKLGKITLAVLYSVIELIFLAFLGIMLFLYLKIYRTGNNKKKQKKKRKKQSQLTN